MSNFSFSHGVFKRLVTQGRQKVSLCGNGLNPLPHIHKFNIPVYMGLDRDAAFAAKILSVGIACRTNKTEDKILKEWSQKKQEDHDGPISLTWVPSSKGVQRL